MAVVPDDVDISGMPDPPADLAAPPEADISDMPTPADVFKQRVGRDPTDPELENFKQHPENWAGFEGDTNPEGEAHAKKFLKILKEHPLTVTAGIAENAFSGITSGVGSLADVVTGAQPGAHDFTYQPRTEAGKQIAAAGSEESANIGQGYDEAFGTGPLAQTVKERGQEALGAISTVVPALKGARALASRIGSGARAAGTISDFGGKAAAEAEAATPLPTAQTPAPEGQVTGEALRAQPDPLAQPAPAEAPMAQANVATPPGAAPKTPTRVPGKPHITLKPQITVPESTPAAPPAPSAPEPVRFMSPNAEGASTGGALPVENQGERLQTLHDLNKLSGNQLGEVRTSAITGDTAETGNDWAHAKVQDAGGRRMQEVIGGETNAIRTAADNLVDRTGTEASGVDQPALRQRGTIISDAIGKIQDWFDNSIKSVYTTAKQRANGIPISDMPQTKALIGTPSEFYGTTEGEALHRGVVARAQHLGLMDGQGQFKPATVEQAEQFRQYLGEQWTPRTAGVIGKLKDALDSDVAQHGGADLFDQARSLRTRRATLLDDPTGIAKLLHPDDRLGINRDVPLEQVPDYVANLPADQFNHVINVLKSSAHLGDGELADSSAAAIREIKGHMAAKLHAAGSAPIQDGWSAKGFYKQANQYANKMPAVFSPKEMGDWKTVNDASNTLRMDRTYKGAKVEEHNIRLGTALRAKAGGLAKAGVDIGAHHVIPVVGPAIAEASGITDKIGRFIGGNPEAAAERIRLGQVEGRITQLNTPENEPTGTNTPTMGQRIGGGRQRGGPAAASRGQ